MTVGSRSAGDVIIDVATAPITWAGQVRSSIGAMDSLGKVATNTWKAAGIIGAESEVLDNVTGQLSAFNGVVGAANIFARGSFWVSLIGKKDAVSSKKVASEVFLTAANVAETTLWLGKTGIVALGAAAPVIELVKNVALLPVSLCNIWNASDEIKKIDDTLRKKEAKVEKWTERKASLQADKDLYVQARIDTCKAKIDVIKAEKQGIKDAGNYTAELKKEFKARVTPLINKHDRWVEVQAQGKLDDFCDYKIAAHGEVVKAAEHNKGKVQTKNWLVIANAVMKLALGIIGLVILLAAITSIWLLALVAAAWAATHALGFAKEMYDLAPANKLIELAPMKTQMLAAPV